MKIVYMCYVQSTFMTTRKKNINYLKNNIDTCLINIIFFNIIIIQFCVITFNKVDWGSNYMHDVLTLMYIEEKNFIVRYSIYSILHVISLKIIFYFKK